MRRSHSSMASRILAIVKRPLPKSLVHCQRSSEQDVLESLTVVQPHVDVDDMLHGVSHSLKKIDWTLKVTGNAVGPVEQLNSGGAGRTCLDPLH